MTRRIEEPKMMDDRQNKQTREMMDTNKEPDRPDMQDKLSATKNEGCCLSMQDKLLMTDNERRDGQIDHDGLPKQVRQTAHNRRRHDK